MTASRPLHARSRVRRARAWRTLAAFGAFVPCAAAAAAAAGGAYVDGPPPGHAGGFDEPSCHACHFENALNAEGGALEIEAPPRYSPGAQYTLRLVIRHPELRRAGFQLAARFAAGPDRGKQAGVLRVAPEIGRVTRLNDVAYAHHVRAGTQVERAGEATWSIEWTAPGRATADVIVHVAANAANNDNSEFGDRIYTASATVLAPAK